MKQITLVAALLVALSMNSQEDVILFETDFSSGDLSDFETVVNSDSDENFTVIMVGSHDTAASVAFDPALVPQDERLITSSLDLSGFATAEIEFNWFASYFWSIDPNENYDINILVSTDGGENYTEIWDETMGQQFESSDDNFLWLEERGADLEIVSLDDYVGESDVLVAFQYLGVDGAQGAFDDITIRANETLSIDDIDSYSFKHYLDIYNNLRVESNIQMSNIKLYSVTGQEVVNLTINDNSKELNISQLQSGIYIAQIDLDSKTESFKIIKK